MKHYDSTKLNRTAEAEMMTVKELETALSFAIVMGNHDDVDVFEDELSLRTMWMSEGGEE